MKIAVTSPSFSKNSRLREHLNRHFTEVAYFPDQGFVNRGDLIAFLQNADAAIVGLDRVDEDLLAHCPRLKFISKYGVGLDNIDQGACLKRGIAIGWTGGVNRFAVAEITLGFMIVSSRNISLTSNQLKNGKWNKDGGRQLSGLTIGIVGCGFVGKEVVRLLQPFGSKIIANDIIDQTQFYREYGVIAADKKEIFQTADIISLHVPLSAETRHLINDQTFSLMKPSAVLINTARGEIVDQFALKRALESNLIAGAAIDVYESEPPLDSVFLKLPQLICTPHIAGNSQEAVFAMGTSAIQNLVDGVRNLGLESKG